MKYILQETFGIALALAISVNPSMAAFYTDPPDANHPWAVHDNNRPQPPRVEPSTETGGPPSDAIVLFDGTEKSLENWSHLKPHKKRKGNWSVEEGTLQNDPGAGYIASKEEFGDCQLHIEWLAPPASNWNGQNRGNSGIFLMGMIEVQVLDNYQNPSYPDGMVGAIYGAMPPAVNPLKGPGEWQSCDIIFRRPIVRNGELLDQGSITVLLNGVVVQASTPLAGGSFGKYRKPLNRNFPDKGSLRLQDHGTPVRYRNIWYRPLRPRPLDGGTDGRLSEEATMTKRAEIASEILADAQELDGLERVLRQLESLLYVKDEQIFKEAENSIQNYLNFVSPLSKNELQAHRETLFDLYKALGHLQKHERIPSKNMTFRQIIALIDKQGWKRKAP